MSDFLAGSISGLSQVIVGFPFDTIKIHLQNGKRIHYRDFLFRHYFRGIPYPMFFSCINNSLSFGVYHSVFSNYSTSSIVSGWVAGLATVPFIHIQDTGKVRRQLGERLTFRHFITTHGIFATILRETTAMSIYFSTYERMKQTNIPTFISGGITGLLNWTLTYPIDVVRNRVYGQRINIREAIQQRDFWRGYSVCALRAILVNSVGFFVFETAKNILEDGQRA